MNAARRGMTLLAACLVTLACRTSGRMASDAQRRAVADSARAIAGRLIENSNRLDFDAVYRDYSRDADARFVENGVLFPSVDSMRRSYAGFAPLLERVDNSVDAWDIMVVGPEAAVVTLPVHLRIKVKGRPEAAGQYVLSLVIQRRGGRWQVVQTHESWQHPEQLMAALTPGTPTNK